MRVIHSDVLPIPDPGVKKAPERKYDGNIQKQIDIDRHGPKPSLNSSQPPDPPPFSLPTTYKLRESTQPISKQNLYV